MTSLEFLLCYSFVEKNRRLLKLPRQRLWSCKPLNLLWGKKRYYFKGKDFCRNQWRKKSGQSSRPRCNKKIAPVITFYHQNDDNKPLCEIDMNNGQDDRFQKCIKIIGDNRSNGKKISRTIFFPFHETHKILLRYLNSFAATNCFVF